MVDPVAYLGFRQEVAAHFEVFPDGEGREDVVVLRDVAQAALGQGVAAGRGDVMSVEEDLPGPGVSAVR